jgi:hypothetical protein
MIMNHDLMIDYIQSFPNSNLSYYPYNKLTYYLLGLAGPYDKASQLQLLLL